MSRKRLAVYVATFVTLCGGAAFTAGPNYQMGNLFGCLLLICTLFLIVDHPGKVATTMKHFIQAILDWIVTHPVFFLMTLVLEALAVTFFFTRWLDDNTTFGTPLILSIVAAAFTILTFFQAMRITEPVVRDQT